MGVWDSITSAFSGTTGGVSSRFKAGDNATEIDGVKVSAEAATLLSSAGVDIKNAGIKELIKSGAKSDWIGSNSVLSLNEAEEMIALLSKETPENRETKGISENQFSSVASKTVKSTDNKIGAAIFGAFAVLAVALGAPLIMPVIYAAFAVTAYNSEPSTAEAKEAESGGTNPPATPGNTKVAGENGQETLSPPPIVEEDLPNQPVGQDSKENSTTTGRISIPDNRVPNTASKPPAEDIGSSEFGKDLTIYGFDNTNPTYLELADWLNGIESAEDKLKLLINGLSDEELKNLKAFMETMGQTYKNCLMLVEKALKAKDEQPEKVTADKAIAAVKDVKYYPAQIVGILNKAKEEGVSLEDTNAELTENEAGWYRLEAGSHSLADLLVAAESIVAEEKSVASTENRIIPSKTGEQTITITKDDNTKMESMGLMLSDEGIITGAQVEGVAKDIPLFGDLNNKTIKISLDDDGNIRLDMTELDVGTSSAVIDRNTKEFKMIPNDTAPKLKDASAGTEGHKSETNPNKIQHDIKANMATAISALNLGNIKFDQNMDVKTGTPINSDVTFKHNGKTITIKACANGIVSTAEELQQKITDKLKEQGIALEEPMTKYQQLLRNDKLTTNFQTALESLKSKYEDFEGDAVGNLENNKIAITFNKKDSGGSLVININAFDDSGQPLSMEKMSGEIIAELSGHGISQKTS